MNKRGVFNLLFGTRGRAGRSLFTFLTRRSLPSVVLLSQLFVKSTIVLSRIHLFYDHSPPVNGPWAYAHATVRAPLIEYDLVSFRQAFSQQRPGSAPPSLFLPHFSPTPIAPHDRCRLTLTLHQDLCSSIFSPFL